MLLAIDVGNSNTVLGLFDGDRIVGHWRVVTGHYRTDDEFRLLLLMLLRSDGYDPAKITGACVASVVPGLNIPLQQALIDGFGVEPLMVGPGVKTGLVLQVENPKEVGADRIVNAVGALEKHDGPLIIIDFGTATTFDVVTAKNEWRGGVIVPGIQLSADALSQHTARLPRVEISTPDTVIGRDTVSNIRAGLTYGYADLVGGLVSRIGQEMGATPKVLATGGLAPTIADICPAIDEVDPWLTLNGVRAVFMKNAKAGG